MRILNKQEQRRISGGRKHRIFGGAGTPPTSIPVTIIYSTPALPTSNTSTYGPTDCTI